MKTILSIVPRLPPAIDGVGDYAWLLSKNLADRHQISSKFIACDPLADPLCKSIDFDPKDPSQIQLSERSTHTLLRALDRFDNIDTLLLQYVGYGYAKRGCPLWLLAALTKWRKTRSSRRLVIMFHEVYASSPLPWSSQFWTSPIQQKIARDLINLGDGLITNSQIFADTIGRLSSKHDGKILILPIFSNIGECAAPLPLKERNPWLVTFGNSGFRRSIYTNSLEQIATVCQQLDIEEIYDIGHNSAEIVREISGVKVNPMGILPATEISEIFQMAQVGFINYPIPYIAKSGIFAAYTSHQLCSVFVGVSAKRRRCQRVREAFASAKASACAEASSRNEMLREQNENRHNLGDNQDGIRLNEHYWAIGQQGDSLDLNLAQSIANNAYQWYDRHSLDRTTSQIATLLNTI
jgi:hypothetical protein